MSGVQFASVSGRSATCQWSEAQEHLFYIRSLLDGTPPEDIQSASLSVCLFPSSNHVDNRGNARVRLSVVDGSKLPGEEGQETRTSSKETAKTFDPADVQCKKNQCQKLSSTRQTPLARRCGWFNVSVTSILRKAMRAGDDKLRLRMLLEHWNTVSEFDHYDNVLPGSPTSCVSFQGSLRFFLPDRITPFLAVIRNRLTLKTTSSGLAKQPLPSNASSMNCKLHQATMNAKPCHVRNVTYHLTERKLASLMTRKRPAGLETRDGQATYWRVTSRIDLKVSMCAGNCQHVTDSDRDMLNLFELVGADYSDITSKCQPTFSSEKSLLVQARLFPLKTINSTKHSEFATEKWRYRQVVACGCSAPPPTAGPPTAGPPTAGPPTAGPPTAGPPTARTST